MFRVDLTGAAGQAVIATNLGNRIEGEQPDSRGSISIGPDGRVYSAIRIETNQASAIIIYIILCVTIRQLVRWKNPDFFNFAADPIKNPDGSLRPIDRNHTLPGGTLTPLHVIMALIVTRDGTIYASTIYPFTLMRIESVHAQR